MKTRPLYHRILLICALLLGWGTALRADLANPHVPAPPPGSQIEKKPGIFSRLLGRIAEGIEGADNDDDDDEDDEERIRPRDPQSPFPPPAPGTTIITTTTTTNRAPIRSVPPGANRYPRVQEQIRAAIVPAATIVVPAVTVAAPAGTVVVMQTPPASRRHQVSPPRSTPPAPSAVRNDTLSLQQPSHLAPSTSIRAPVAPAAPPTPAPAASSFADRFPVPVTPGQDPPSANPPGAQPPAPPPQPPFGTPVPGRRGLVYPPGQEATPENMIDVTDYAPGTKVRDPVSKAVFRVPWSS